MNAGGSAAKRRAEIESMNPENPDEESAIRNAMQHWIDKAVIGLNLCPFAKSVVAKKQVRIVVSRARHIDAFLEELDHELALLAETDPAEIDTTLLVHPTLLPEFLDFNDFVELAEAAVSDNAYEGAIQIASFHPRFQFEGTDPDDIGNFTNRAPYPTLHLLREASIERAVEAFPEAATIFERNIETLEKLGIAGWKALGMKHGLPDNES